MKLHHRMVATRLLAVSALLLCQLPLVHSRLHAGELVHINPDGAPPAGGAAPPATPQHAWPEEQQQHTQQTEGEENVHEAPAILDTEELEGDRTLADTRKLATWVFAPIFGVLIICLIVDNCFHKFAMTHLIPSSVWTIICSSMLGLLARNLMDSGMLHEEHMTFGLSSLLNLVLLPIIIFASGWSLDHGFFLQQLEYILIFAVLGTLVTFGIIAFGLAWLGTHNYTVVSDVRENMVFAALISAIDPVATLATFAHLQIDKAQPLLHNLVFGESVVNDAVAITLFNCVNRIALHDMSTKQLLIEIGTTLFMSSLLGFLLASVLVALLRFATNKHHFSSEVIYLMSSAFFVYSAAEAFHFSGIIANLVAGSVFKMYGVHHLTENGRIPAENALTVAGEMCDTMVFMICGICCGMLTPGQGIPFITFSIIFCLVARLFAVPFCAGICNMLKTLNKSTTFIKWQHQVMMWHAGLRGGIALVLALEIDATWCTQKGTIINSTFSVICFTLLVFGSSTKIMLDIMGFDYPKDQHLEDEPPSTPPIPGPKPLGPSEGVEEEETLFRNRIFQRIHDVMAVMLVGEKIHNVVGVSKNISQQSLLGALSPRARPSSRHGTLGGEGSPKGMTAF